MKLRNMLDAKRRRIRSVAAVWLPVISWVTFGLTASLPCLADDAAKRTLMAEYPKASERLAASLAVAKGPVILSMTVKNKTGEAKGEFAVDHGFTKLTFDNTEYVKTEREIVRRVLCGKDQRVFYLKKPSSSQDYLVVDAGNDSEAADELDDRFRSLISAPYSAGYVSAGYVDFATVLKSPEFLIEDVTESIKDGSRTFSVRIRFASEPSRRARVDLAPDLGWAVRRAVIEQGDDESDKDEFIVEYGPMVDGVPVPRSVTHWTQSVSYGCRFQQISHEHTDIAEFSMKYYGLPDLTLVGNAWGPYTWLTLMAIAACFAALGAYLAIRWWRRR